MDFSDSESYNDSEEVEKGGKRGCFGRLLRFIFFSVTAVVLLVCGFAFFLSTDLGRLWVLNKINRSIAPASLSVEKWNVGFVGSAKLSGVEYYSPDDGLRVVVPHLSFAKGAFAFIPIGKLALGDITLDSPVITYDRAEAAENRAGPGEADDRSGKDESEDFFLPVADIGGSLFVKSGSFIIKDRDKRLFSSDSIDGRLLVDSFWRPFGFEIKGAAGNGTFGFTGDMQSLNSLFSGGDSDYSDKLVLQLAGVDLSAFTPVLVMINSPVLPYAGVAEGALTLVRSGNGAELKLEGGMLIEKMQLITGEEECSPAGDVALLVDSEIRDNRCVFRKFDFSSPWGRLKLNGSLQQLDESQHVAGDIDADLDLDLAAVSRDFRYALDIDEDLVLKKGRLVGTVKINGSQGDLRVDGNLKAAGLSMQYDGRIVELTRDPSLSLKMHLPADQLPEVEELKFSSSFADVYGKGNISRAVLKGYVDLSQFSKDFRGLLADGLIMGGAAHFNLSTEPSGDGVTLDVMTKLSRFNITSAKLGASSVQEGSFSCNGKVFGAESAKSIADLEFKDLGYDLRLNNSRVQGAVKRFVAIQHGEILPVIRGLTLSADLSLPDTIKAFGILMDRKSYLDAVKWKGNIIANAAVESANGVAKARLNGAGRDIAFSVGERKISEPDLRFGGAVTFDSIQNRITLSDVEVSSDAFNAKAAEWYVQLPEDGSDLQFNGGVDASIDVALLYPLLVTGSKNYDQVRGELTVGIVAASGSGGTAFKLNGVLTDMYLLNDGEIDFYEKRAELKSEFTLRKTGDEAHVKSLELYSSLADISASGNIKDLWKSRIADIEGTLDFKFDTLDRLLRVRGIDEWKITGHKKSPFNLVGPLTEEFLQKGSFTGGAYPASLTGLGLSAGGAPLSLELKQGQMMCDWSPVLNGGKLRLLPVFEFNRQGTALSIPVGTQVLEDVKVTQEMVDKLLVHLNPMFQGSRLHQGTIDLKVNSFRSGPIAGHADLTADTQMAFNEFKISLSPAMRDVLKMINVKSTTYSAKQLPVHMMVRNERVYIDPMTMVFSDQPVTFSGSVGFNSTIKYLIEIPLSESISAKTGIKLPKGLTVKVPVTGTVDNPKLDTGALEKSVGGFIQKTLGDDAVKNVTDFFNQLKKELK